MDAIHAVQNCIKDIRTWMTVDKLKLNEDKTEFIVIGTPAQLNKVRISQLTIGHMQVFQLSLLSEILDLGLIAISV